MFSASFLARMHCRSACLESEAASKSVFYYVLDRTIAHKKNVCIETGRKMLFAVFAVFAVFPALEFTAWIILP
jgi:hypothetical protein